MKFQFAANITIRQWWTRVDPDPYFEIRDITEVDDFMSLTTPEIKYVQTIKTMINFRFDVICVIMARGDGTGVRVAGRQVKKNHF